MRKIHPRLDYSGGPFARPGIFAAVVERPWLFSAAAILSGEDSTNVAGFLTGQDVYAGYYNGTFANLNALRQRFGGSGAIILSITPNGMAGARCIDVEPGDATIAEGADFVASNLPATPDGGLNDGGKPMVYVSGGDAQAMVDAVTAKGIARDQWTLWTAHWTMSPHICTQAVCGFPDADATQWADGPDYDSDSFYDYCFGSGPVNPTFPLHSGDIDATVTGPVHVLQGNLNAWAPELKLSPVLVVDGDFGAKTAAAVTLAQSYFKVTGPAGTCSLALYTELANPAFPLHSGDIDATADGPVHKLQGNLNRWAAVLKLTVPLAADGDFGAKTAAAVSLAQAHFKDTGAAGTCSLALYTALAGPLSPPPPPPPPPVKPPLLTPTVKGTLVRVTGTAPVYWWNGTQLWHVPDAAVLAFMAAAGFSGHTLISEAQLKLLGPVISLQGERNARLSRQVQQGHRRRRRRYQHRAHHGLQHGPVGAGGLRRPHGARRLPGAERQRSRQVSR